MVCAGDIFVFNRELELVRKISPNEGPEIKAFCFMDVSSDHHGNLYACAHYDTKLFRNASGIGVFTNSGQPLRVFGVMKSPAAKGVCALGEYVYLTCFNKLTVYTTEGTLVTTIDLNNNPCGICADKDGYIYICARGRVYVM